ncbi:LexA family transcriptional regulator [Bacteroides sp.]|uniref:LexA family protein n=1 Tax=Bacteroides sp. TaxID=29523 RepID=UPI00260B235D|nr:translesion error-prone DNA polymerase V autoproteolytic subunit [Bacteroides sp.]MDD3038594.1 translesion error-prone DNA polymerase V autoproteolytic subunit [Bacteroides sp.]
MKKTIEIHRIDLSSSLPIPYADEGIRAGFPSPAQDYMEMAIDLNKELIKHPASTFYGRVKGDSMKDAGVLDGDVLIIDKSLEPKNGDMAVCFIDGEFTLKYIEIEEKVIWLKPANEEYPPTKVTEYNDFIIWGIVTYVIKKTRNNKHF